MTPAQLAEYDQIASSYAPHVDALIGSIGRLQARGRSREEAVCDVTAMLQTDPMFADVITLSNLLGILLDRMSTQGGGSA
jgi:hypothetical protein